MMLKKLPMILLALVAIYLVYRTGLVQRLNETIKQTIKPEVDEVGSEVGAEIVKSDAVVADMDMGMYDVPNEMAFGTTQEAERRITNDGVRKEYHHNPFPWAECGCDGGCDKCDKRGVPDPTPGQTHVCKNGFPSKRIIDMYGGHFQLNHICAPGSADSCSGEPATLGRWWCRKGCAGAESVGLNVRSACTRCA